MNELRDLRRVLAGGVCAWALIVGVGCEAFNGDDDDDLDDDRAGDVISGGSGARPAAVPAGARIVDQGGGDVSFTADTAGTAYIVDVNTGRLILSRDLVNGQRLVVEPDEDRVSLDGQAIFQQNLERNNTHAVWWEPNAASGGTATGGTSTGELPREIQNSDRVAFGRGDLSFTPQEDGRIFVWDTTDRRIVYQGEASRGQRVLVSPQRGYISLGSAASFQNQVRLDANHSYEIYFDRR